MIRRPPSSPLSPSTTLFRSDRRIVQAHWLTPPDNNASLFYARCRQESMCRAIETVLGFAAAAVVCGENSVSAGRIRVGLSHKFIEAVDHKLSGRRVGNDNVVSPALQLEGAPDAQHRPLRDPESRRETTAAPARGTRRFFVQRPGEHCLHQGIA